MGTPIAPVHEKRARGRKKGTRVPRENNSQGSEELVMSERSSALGRGRDNPRWQGEGLALAIARTVMVCGIRKPHTIGYEMLALGGIVKTAIALFVVNSALNLPIVTWLLGNQITKGDDFSLRLFAIGFLVVALWLRHQRKREKFDPNRPHRLDPGISWFTFLSIRNDYIYRFVDPGVTFLVGAELRWRLGAPLLGIYYMVAAAALASVEWNLHQQSEQHDWQLGDGPKEAARDGEIMQAMGRRETAASHETAIPTGVDANLAADIKRRQQEREGEVSHDVN